MASHLLMIFFLLLISTFSIQQLLSELEDQTEAEEEHLEEDEDND